MRSTVELALTLREENMTRDTHDIIKDVAILTRLERKLHKLAESACNGFPVVEIRDGKRYEYSQLTEEQQDHIDKKKADYTARAAEIAAHYGATVTAGGDPRGAVLRLNLKSGRKNGWGEGWCV